MFLLTVNFNFVQNQYAIQQLIFFSFKTLKLLILLIVVNKLF